MDFYAPTTERHACIPDTTTALFTAISHGDLDARVTAGDLVEVPADLHGEAGFQWPLYLTREAWARHVTLSETARAAFCDETGRLWDAVYMLSVAMKVAVRQGLEGVSLRFTFYGITTTRAPHLCTLFAHTVGAPLGPVLIVATAPESVGKEMGDAIDTYGRMLGMDTDEDDDGDWL